jgi:hypothetical protein
MMPSGRMRTFVTRAETVVPSTRIVPTVNAAVTAKPAVTRPSEISDAPSCQGGSCNLERTMRSTAATT